jgi:PKD repeat protein
VSVPVVGAGRRLFVLVVSSLLVVSALTVGAAPASQAAPLPPVPGATPLPTVQIDGVAWQTLVWGDTVYVGGKFTTARPAGAAPGVDTVVRQNLLAFDLVTGELKTAFVANTNAQVYALTMAPDGSRLYVGGEFTNINGTNRYRIAALNPTTGAVDTSFRAQTDYRVRSILVTNDTVYAGGSFGVASNQPRQNLAAWTRSGGFVLNWAPQAGSGQVMALAQVPGSDRIVVGGAFTSINGVAAVGLAAVDPVSGATMEFPTNQLIKNGGSAAAIYSLSADAGKVYGSGYTFGSGGNFEGNFAADGAGNLQWVNDSRGDQYDVAPARGMLFSAGHSHSSPNVEGGYPQANPWKFWHSIANTADATGTVQPPNNGRFNFAGNPAPSLLHWYPEYTPGAISGAEQAAWTVAADNRYVVVAGEFPQVNLQAQQGIVRFAFKDVRPPTEAPRFGGAGFVPLVSSPASGVAQISFPGNWDRTDDTLSYSVQREGAGTIWTGSRFSSFHTLPVTNVIDRGLLPGSTQRYRVVATNDDGLKAIGDWVPVTISSSGTLSSYAATVLADGPTTYRRLDDAARTSTADAAWAPTTGTSSSGVVAGVPGAIAGDPGTAFRYNGSGQNSWSNALAINPRAMTSEAWVKTTTTTGGMIVGWGNRAGTTTSSSVDYVTYLGKDGKVRFGVFEGTRQVLTSPAAINDGKWHHVVASLDWASGQRLYVDGQLVASNPNVKHGRDYNGYWRIGSDNLSGWEARPTTDAISADIDEVAVYLEAVPADRVRAHHEAGVGLGNQPPAAAFTASATNLRVAFDASASTDPDGTIEQYSWSFGDGTTATGAAPVKDYAVAGTYAVTLTVRDEDGATSATTQQITVTAPPPDTSVYASDEFARTLASGWGTADSGGTWTLVGGSAGFGADGAAGLQKLTAPGANRDAALAVGQTDVEVTTAVALDKPATGGGVYVTIGARKNGTSSYAARLRYLADGSVVLNNQRIVSGAATSLSGGTIAGLTATPGTYVNVKLRVSGTGTTTIASKVWLAGTPEPAAWTTTATDSTAALQVPGGVGIGGYLSGSATNAPVNVLVDRYVAGPLPAA